ncbi:DUF402 domain-containing protein [Agromyces laixinhei]|uniref:DUF402 domain-containing protein n=1 Tax=Agromyces laixinhei TaxID=2585717 RepID=UPI00143D5E62|nr:DUF402 domain-containing protein [Agromyces laixinhei]
MSSPDDRPSVPGDLVRVRAMKWPEQPHWEFDGRWLGSDEHGDWIGFPAGTRFDRPGHGFIATWDSVTLFPREGWAATFCTGHPRGVGIYVDIATVSEWRADASVPTLSYVDLDLDVVERAGAPAFIEDEDEFAEHAVEFGYPPEVVARARADADAVLRAVQRRDAPFDGATSAAWLERDGLGAQGSSGNRGV